MSEFLAGLFSLHGKVAIVTGGSRGIGAALAIGLQQAGARVFALARSQRQVVKLPESISYRTCDVTRDTDFRQICADIAGSQKRLDILVNAAGVSIPDAADVDPLEHFDLTLNTNLRAAYAACLSVAPHMRKTGGGSIINVTSINSVLGFSGNPGYVAAKGGLRMLTKALSMDLAESNIRVNALAPGYFRTGMTSSSYANEALRAQRTNRMIIQRWGEPEDLVGAAVFLASSASAYVTGQDLFVDGGWTAKGL